MTAYGTWGYGYNYFSYSGDSLEIAGEHSSSPTVQFSWDTRSSLPLILSDGTDDYIYGPLGVPIEQINVSQPQNNSGNGTDNPTYLYYSPTSTLTGFIVVNTAGMLDNGELYDSYGNNLIGTGPETTFGYQGQYYGNAADTSGFYYMRARYYDPPTGQFTSMDPQYLSTYQAYSYANGNPISGSDPSGEGGSICVGLVEPVACWGGSHRTRDQGTSTSSTAYQYQFNLGSYPGISVSALASYVHSNCKILFPIFGCNNNFVVGETLYLQWKLLVYTQSLPVKVVGLTSFGWEFVALPGHPEGPGRHIVFQFDRNSGGSKIYLSVGTSSNGAFLTTQCPILRAFDFFFAHRVWTEFADNIKRSLGR